MAMKRLYEDVWSEASTLEFMKAQSPHYKGDCNFVEEQAVCDSDIITANGTASLEFAREIMLYLNLRTAEKIEEWYKANKVGFYPSQVTANGSRSTSRL